MAETPRSSNVNVSRNLLPERDQRRLALPIVPPHRSNPHESDYDDDYDSNDDFCYPSSDRKYMSASMSGGSKKHRKRTTTTPLDGAHRPHHHHHHHSTTTNSTTKSTIAVRRRFQRVSRQVGRVTKEKLWNSNEMSIKAALTAVDQWEACYNALRLLLVTSVHSARGIYGAAKEGVGTLEHGLLMPSQQARQLGHETLELARNVPVIGSNLLAPTLCFSVGFLQRTWEIAQYPIPSKEQVRDTVDDALTGTKWALSRAAREIFLYVKRADANITRTISHTQWKLVGSGPYASLDDTAKAEVIDHLCERYFSLTDPVARYELAAHVRTQNRPLYHDLVLTGLLKQRGSDLTSDDEWLSSAPCYRQLEEAFLIRQQSTKQLTQQSTTTDGEHLMVDVSALWFRLPFVNGNRPARDAPWIVFSRKEQKALEHRYLEILREGEGVLSEPPVVEERLDDPLFNDQQRATPLWPTIAQWYDVDDPASDVLVDQKRHAVSYMACCPKCRLPHAKAVPPLTQKRYGDVCASCIEHDDLIPSVCGLLMPPPVAMVMRPTFWRFHGPGDEVRRATWFLDTPRVGLQPFDDEATSILEDAYLFLKWMSKRQAFETDTIDGVLLTVEVPCPDGAERLVQFSSLSRATAIQKGLGAAVALFKRQVFRGAWIEEKSVTEKHQERVSTVEESLINAIEEHGALGDTLVPNMSIRLALSPAKVDMHEDRLVLYEDEANSLAADPELLEETMGKYLNDQRDGKIDHLVLIVHGIGEMLRSIDVFGLSLPNLSSIVDCCAYLRKNHLEVQDAHFTEMYPSADEGTRSATGRVEYLPIEWHEAFSILSQRLRPSESNGLPQRKAPHVMLKDITPRTIPNLRDFANDTLMDVLYFMSPEHHDIIIDVVTNEMNVVVDKFRRLSGFNGRISVIGHSLGSIIAWDMLANQIPRGMRGVASDESFDTVSGTYSPALNIDRRAPYVCAPEVTDPPLASLSDYPPLSFTVDNFFLLGSPVAVFLMIRNQRKPLSDDFYLKGCRRVYNIYHPYDPVAYRIEPCIDPRNADVEATIMKHWNGGFRVQYQTKRLWRKLVDTTWKAQHSVVEMFEASMAGMGLVDTAVSEDTDDEDMSASDTSYDDTRMHRVVTGQLNQGRRVDYMMQEREIENANEYVAALAAHSSYWTEKDLSLFVARQIYLSSLEQQAEQEESDNWDDISSLDF
ncbi:S23-interacting protein [Mayamaea pseudoterrestris]|nr:S23-interacting protein [Mayamaea pseudoterrestris]